MEPVTFKPSEVTGTFAPTWTNRSRFYDSDQRSIASWMRLYLAENGDEWRDIPWREFDEFLRKRGLGGPLRNRATSAIWQLIHHPTMLRISIEGADQAEMLVIGPLLMEEYTYAYNDGRQPPPTGPVWTSSDGMITRN